MSKFQQHCEEIAERFLQTAVIVDDQARIDDSFVPPVSLKTPDRHTLARNPEEIIQAETDACRTLDARLLVDSFSERGLICAVIAPRPFTESSANVAIAARRADIVILDWQLNGDGGRQAISILNKILEADAGDRLRLIALYTGEQNISEIGRTIARELESVGWKFNLCDRDLVLSLGHCRIVIYAKSDTKLTKDLKDRSLSELEVPKRLISDFANMTTGLLPSVTLTSLAAIRENAHKILDKFHAGLDAAFLSHRACLPSPADSQQHLVSQIAAELHAIMDDAAATTDPAGIKAITEWLEASAGQDADFTFGSDKKLTFKQTVSLLDRGIDREPGSLNKKKDFRKLTAGFSGKRENGNDLDLQMAWMINFRTVFNSPNPILHLGTVLRKRNLTW
ncbi:hypothetical protein C4565_04865 [Candidatus Parcubacteria bacterium]|nr:MAG: hypothetical protein C4565_04865 [Candidatus Parcubacteria bacterium]